MGTNTKVPWAHHSFNSWWGCTKTKYSGCVNCYAEKYASSKGYDIWGKGKKRRYFPKSHFQQLLTWQKNAAIAGEYHRIFIGSLCDVFDDEVSNYWRNQLWQYFDVTPNLIKMLTTKRPQNIVGMYPAEWLSNPRKDACFLFSVSDQESADEIIPLAAKIPALVRGISYEPAIGPINFAGLIEIKHTQYTPDNNFHWIVIGGESAGGRPFELDWAYDTELFCRHAGISFYMKQLGSHLAAEYGIADIDPKGEMLDHIPEDLRIREFPELLSPAGAIQ